MAYEQKPGDISVFKNTPKDGRELSPRAPNLTGYMIAHRDIRAGEKLEVSLWSRESSNGGNKFLSGQVQDPYQPQPSSPPQSAERGRDEWLS